MFAELPNIITCLLGQFSCWFQNEGPRGTGLTGTSRVGEWCCVCVCVCVCVLRVADTNDMQ